jgi:hypothetical protein
MSWTLVDHGLSFFSSLDEIERWERVLDARLQEHPDDEGLLTAIEDVRRIRRGKLGIDRSP